MKFHWLINCSLHCIACHLHAKIEIKIHIGTFGFKFHDVAQMHMFGRRDEGKLITTEIKTTKQIPNCIFIHTVVHINAISFRFVSLSELCMFYSTSEWVRRHRPRKRNRLRNGYFICTRFFYCFLFVCLFVSNFLLSFRFIRKVYFYVAQWENRLYRSWCVVAIDHLKRPVVC